MLASRLLLRGAAAIVLASRLLLASVSLSPNGNRCRFRVRAVRAVTCVRSCVREIMTYGVVWRPDNTSPPHHSPCHARAMEKSVTAPRQARSNSSSVTKKPVPPEVVQPIALPPAGCEPI